MPLRIVFMGTAQLACASLLALKRDARFHIIAVVTQPDKPGGRHLQLQPSPVKQTALAENLPVLQPARARDEQFIAQLAALKPDLIVVAAYGQILPAAILELPPHGCVNVHTSLLPRWRGASPIQSAILNGDAETGVTIMQMDAGLDTGPILTQRATPIRADDNAATLHDRLAEIGAELLVATVVDLVAGTISARPQPFAGMTHAAKIKKADGQLDWNGAACELWNRLRAFTPWPGAFTRWGEAADEPGSRGRSPHLLKIWSAEALEQSGAPGEVLSADASGIVVACGSGALKITVLQLEGGKRLTAQEFLSGHSLKPGQKLG